jgi:hypothetical protein
MVRQAIRKSVRFEIFKRDSFTCQYCGAKSPDVVLEIDHITPVADGGTNDILNLVTACRACNAGKSDRRLSDSAAIDKRRTQLEELEERRQQIEMLHEWHLSLVDIEDQAADMAGDLWFRSTGRAGSLLTTQAKEELAKLIRRNGFDSVCKAIKQAADSAMRSSKDHHEACCEWFWKIGRVISVSKMEEKDPGVARLLYIRGILRNRCPSLNEAWCISLLRQAKEEGISVEWMEGLAKQVTSWSQFRDIVSETMAEGQPSHEEATDGAHS